MEEKFKAAVDRSKQLPQKPTNEELLNMYSLFKQASEGDNLEERPGGFDFKAIAKHDAWANLKGMGKEEAMDKYVALIDDLYNKYA